MNNEESKLWAAKVVAVIIFVSVASLMLFPWVIPFVWEMPENTTMPYYGLLVMFESLRATIQYNHNQNKKKKCKVKKCQN